MGDKIFPDLIKLFEREFIDYSPRELFLVDVIMVNGAIRPTLSSIHGEHLPLFNHHPRLPPSSQGWEYSAVMFICVNTVSLLFIGASYIKMLRAIKQTSAEAMRPTLSGRENVVARRFAVIVATDCACWLPIIIVKMAALTGEAECSHRTMRMIVQNRQYCCVYKVPVIVGLPLSPPQRLLHYFTTAEALSRQSAYRCIRLEIKMMSGGAWWRWVAMQNPATN